MHYNYGRRFLTLDVLNRPSPLMGISYHVGDNLNEQSSPVGALRLLGRPLEMNSSLARQLEVPHAKLAIMDHVSLVGAQLLEILMDLGSDDLTGK